MLTREVTSPRSWLPTIALAAVSSGLALVLAAGMMLLLSGCADIKSAGGEVGGTLAEWIACPTELIDCGHVYLFAQEADNPLGHVELCVNDDADDGAEQLADAEAIYGASEPTPRHEGLCIWCCGPDCGRGANAYNGAYCP